MKSKAGKNKEPIGGTMENVFFWVGKKDQLKKVPVGAKWVGE